MPDEKPWELFGAPITDDLIEWIDQHSTEIQPEIIGALDLSDAHEGLYGRDVDWDKIHKNWNPADSRPWRETNLKERSGRDTGLTVKTGEPLTDILECIREQQFEPEAIHTYIVPDDPEDGREYTCMNEVYYYYITFKDAGEIARFKFHMPGDMKTCRLVERKPKEPGQKKIVNPDETLFEVE